MPQASRLICTSAMPSPHSVGICATLAVRLVPPGPVVVVRLLMSTTKSDVSLNWPLCKPVRQACRARRGC
jgi:hypothetical protein